MVGCGGTLRIICYATLLLSRGSNSVCEMLSALRDPKMAQCQQRQHIWNITILTRTQFWLIVTWLLWLQHLHARNELLSLSLNGLVFFLSPVHKVYVWLRMTLEAVLAKEVLHPHECLGSMSEDIKQQLALNVPHFQSACKFKFAACDGLVMFFTTVGFPLRKRSTSSGDHCTLQLHELTVAAMMKAWANIDSSRKRVRSFI